ncbi:MAG: hypothetical protein OEV92_02745 [Nitrospinota bacterium]|nr:hypothetical protein [Nitrospinota bacterium]
MSDSNGQAIRGIIVLHPPPDRATAMKISEFLAEKVFKKPVDKIAQVTLRALETGAPVTLIPSAPKPVAMKIISALATLGARAEFVEKQAGSARTANAEIAPDAAGSKMNTKPAARVDSYADKKRPLHHTQPDAGLAKGSLAASSASGAGGRRPAFSARTWIMLAITLGLFFKYGFHHRLINMAIGAVSASTASAGFQNAPRAVPKSVKTRGGVDYYMAEGRDPLEEFDYYYSPYYDYRLVEGLEEAIRLYAKMFDPGKSAQIVISKFSSKQNHTEYKVSVKARAGGGEWKYDFMLSADHAQAGANMEALRKALLNFIQSGSGPPPPSSIQIRPWKGLEKAEERALSFDMNQMLGVLAEISSHIYAGEVDPRAVKLAGDIFALMAFIKSSSPTLELENRLATRAVAMRLIAMVLDKSLSADGSDLGPTWLGLGYRAGALAAFGRGSSPGDGLAGLLRMYAGADEPGLKTILRANGPESRAAGYLYARLILEDGRMDQFDELTEELLGKNPEFMALRELTFSQPWLSPVRAAFGEFLYAAIQNQRRVAEVLSAGQAAGLHEHFPTGIQPGSIPDLDEISTHVEAVSAMAAPAGGSLLEPEFLKSYMELDLQNAYYAVYEYLAKALGDHVSARYMTQTLEAIFPDSDIVQVMRIRERYEQGDYAAAIAIAKRVNRNVSGAYLLAWVLEVEVYDLAHTDDMTSVKIILMRMRKGAPANSAGFGRLGFCHITSFNGAVGRMYFNMAIQMDPYSARTYRKYAKYADTGDFLSWSGVPTERSYSLMLLQAQWRLDRGETTEAELVLSKALTRYPKEYATYLRLGELYMGAKEYEKAERIWSRYLTSASPSLREVHIRNMITRSRLERGQYEAAYAMAQEPMRSGQGDALDLYAMAAEKLGKTDEAKRIRELEAARYPTSSAPVRLAMFHLRQNDASSAVSVLSSHKQNHYFLYYKEKVVEAFVQAGKVDKAFDFVQTVEGKGDDVRVRWVFGVALMDKGYFREAAEVFRPMISRSAAAAQQPYTFAMLYYRAMTEGKLADEATVLNEIDQLMEKDRKVREFFAIVLMSQGLYDPAYYVIKRNLDAHGFSKDVEYYHVAFAWLGGSRAPDRTNWLRSLSQKPESQWTKALIKFMLGELELEKLQAMVDGDKEKSLELHYTLGMNSLKEGDPLSATRYFQICMDTTLVKSLEYKLALNELRRLGKTGKRT